VSKAADDSSGLEVAHQLGAADHEGICVEASAYASFVRERLGDQIPAEGIAQDLYLACACLHGKAGALEAFDQRFLSQVPSFLARLESACHRVDEVQQLLRERLFVARGDAPPKIADYKGQGRLASWLRVAAIRTALNLHSSRKSQPPPSAAPAELLLASPDPELQYLRARYKEQFNEAFVTALGSLAARDRTVLRLHLLDGLNIDRIGQVFDVHRATAARWLSHAREELFEKTREALTNQLGLSATEFASIVRLIRSDLDLSVCRILREQPA